MKQSTWIWIAVGAIILWLMLRSKRAMAANTAGKTEETKGASDGGSMGDGSFSGGATTFRVNPTRETDQKAYAQTQLVVPAPIAPAYTPNPVPPRITPMSDSRMDARPRRGNTLDQAIAAQTLYLARRTG